MPESKAKNTAEYIKAADSPDSPPNPESSATERGLDFDASNGLSEMQMVGEILKSLRIISEDQSVNSIDDLRYLLDQSNHVFLESEGRKLRRGYTTGSSLCAASVVALRLLTGLEISEEVKILLPHGGYLAIPLFKAELTGPDRAYASVIKDAGDDADVTDGAEIGCELRIISDLAQAEPQLLAKIKEHSRQIKAEITEAAAQEEPAIRARAIAQDLPPLIFKGGKGVGQITLPGLKLPPGEPAINPAPRKMIQENFADLWQELDEKTKEQIKAIELTAIVPDGEKLGAKTFNPRLGIVGGISIIGTTGIVEPLSEEAYKASIVAEIAVARAKNAEKILLVAGNASEKRALQVINQDDSPADLYALQFGNFIGFVIAESLAEGFKELIICGPLGKMIKVAAGIFQTHSHLADARIEIILANAFLCDVSSAGLKEISKSVTSDAALEIIQAEGKGERFIERVSAKINERIRREYAGEYDLRIILTDGRSELLYDGFYQNEEKEE